ncbi:Ig-like domain-containing protein [Rhizobacter sp. P5_C2]
MTRTVSVTRTLPALLLTLLLVACGGGGGDSTNDTTLKPSPPDVPASGPMTADTQPPVVSASATVSTKAVALTALATDNVGVTSVSFIVDGGSIPASVQKSPSDGSYTSSLQIEQIPSGTHSFVAVAVDAAGNSTTSAEAGFTVGTPIGAPGSNDTVPPTITAAVQGNFGLIKLTAIAKDETRLFGVDFLVDGQLTGTWASLHYLSSDPADQYYVLFDTTTLSPGAHTVVARARDLANHTTLSDEIVLNVDPAAGLTETEPNNTRATANAVPAGQLQISGTLKNETEVIGSSKIVHTDSDYYQLTIPTGQTLTVSMLTPQHQGFSVSIVDANGDKLSGESEWPSSGEVRVAYKNGAAARDVWIRLSSIPYDFETRNQYTLTLSLQ